jgi:hypothetical protein
MKDAIMAEEMAAQEAKEAAANKLQAQASRG